MQEAGEESPRMHGTELYSVSPIETSNRFAPKKKHQPEPTVDVSTIQGTNGDKQGTGRDGDCG